MSYANKFKSLASGLEEIPVSQNRFAAFSDDRPARKKETLPPMAGYSTWKKKEGSKPENVAKKLEVNETNFPRLGGGSATSIHSTSLAPKKSFADRLKETMAQEEEMAQKRYSGVWQDTETTKEEPTISIPLPGVRRKLKVISHDFPPYAPPTPPPSSPRGDKDRDEELRQAWQASDEIEQSCFVADDEEPPVDYSPDQQREDVEHTTEEAEQS